MAGTFPKSDTFRFLFVGKIKETSVPITKVVMQERIKKACSVIDTEICQAISSVFQHLDYVQGRHFEHLY